MKLNGSRNLSGLYSTVPPNLPYVSIQIDSWLEVERKGREEQRVSHDVLNSDQAILLLRGGKYHL